MNISEGSNSGLLHDLKWRGLLHMATPDLDLNQPCTIYLGIDPTANSLHVGSLLPIVCINKFIEYGHSVIILLGDGTAMIGDPSGKKGERKMLSSDDVDTNLYGIESQLNRLVPKAKILHNAEWLMDVSILSFLRSVGKHFSINYMRAKDSVRMREDSGISFTEFSYMLLQAYDFLHLFKNHGCTVQIGGSDQWGNITCGIELIKRESGESVHGLTFPLLTNTNGEKFGKSADGAIWLDPTMTSPYHFHQFWLNVDDSVVIQYLKYFTSLSQDSIIDIESGLNKNSKKRVAQTILADAVTRLVHGETEVVRVKQMRDILFGRGGDISFLNESEINSLFGNLKISHPEIKEEGVCILDLLNTTALYSSKSEARRAIQSGGVYINGSRVEDINMIITKNNLLIGNFLVLRKGKKDYALISFN